MTPPEPVLENSKMGKIHALLHLQISVLVARATGNLHNCGQGPRSDVQFRVLHN